MELSQQSTVVFNSKSCYLEDGIQDKGNKGTWETGAISSGRRFKELASARIKVPKVKHMV